MLHPAARAPSRSPSSKETDDRPASLAAQHARARRRDPIPRGLGARRDRRAPRPHRRGEPGAERPHCGVRRSSARSRRRCGRGFRRRQGPGGAGRGAVHREGEHRPQLVGHDERLELPRERGAARRRHDGRATPRGRRHPHRPRQHARLRAALGHRQRPLRPHDQPVGRRPSARRIERRRRGGGRHRHGAARPRQRLRRIAAAAGLRRRGVRAPADGQPHSRPRDLDGRAGAADAAALRRQRADRPDRRRPRHRVRAHAGRRRPRSAGAQPAAPVDLRRGSAGGRGARPASAGESTRRSPTR